MILKKPDFLNTDTDQQEEAAPASDLPEQAPLLAKAAREAAQSESRSLEVYRVYQENIRRGDQLRTEITKGVKEGESLYSLLLKACEAISLMTGESLFYDTVKSDTLEIYGAGLEVAAVLEADIAETRGRLEKLTAAAQSDPDNQRIKKAIQSHKDRITRLEAKRE